MVAALQRQVFEPLARDVRLHALSVGELNLQLHDRAEVTNSIQPSAERIRTIPSWDWLRIDIGPDRSRTLVTAARVGDSLDRLTGDVADARLRTLPGVGVWTSSEVRQRAFGDPDAVSFGDYHVAKDIGWALLGRRIDDSELATLLEPWRPHRGAAAIFSWHCYNMDVI